MQRNAYSSRLRSRRSAESLSSDSEEELESHRYGVYTPEPVQRTLELEDDDYDDDFDELDDYEGTMYRSTTYRPPPVDEEDVAETEEVEDDEEETPPAMRRSELKRRAAGAAAFLQTQQSSNSLLDKVKSNVVVKTLLKYLRRLWRFVLRNSFMAVNVLWLLAPLCCFVIAITVPQYLTTAIQYVDVLSSSVTGKSSVAMDKGAMQAAVQEIVDLKLSGVNEELSQLRKTVQSQGREIEALRLLHDSLQHSHDEAQQKFSLVESESAVNVHIETVVTKHTEELWEKFISSTSQLGQDMQTTMKQQSTLSTAIKAQEEKLDTLQDVVQKAAASASAKPATITSERDTRKEFSDWRKSFEHELQTELQQKVRDIENRMSKVLQEEKRALSSSAAALRGLDATDPGILRVIEVAVQAVEIKKTGRLDHAALANGASVIHTDRDLLYPDDSSPMRYLANLVGWDNAEEDGRFTSPSYRHAPAPFFGLLLSSGEIPWWLSRHNGRPETALSETMEIGSCWGIAGSSGRLSVKFAQEIIADSVTIDHIPAQIAADFRSAPNEFRILGISGHPLRETVKFIPFGNFSYDSNGAASQTFKLTSPVSQRSPIDGMTLEVLSNHGHPDFTCLYRFRVHGQPV